MCLIDFCWSSGDRDDNACVAFPGETKRGFEAMSGGSDRTESGGVGVDGHVFEVMFFNCTFLPFLGYYFLFFGVF